MIRFGIVAQYYSVNFTFLIDGFANHGNSGSPVFSLKNKKLIGMVNSYLSDHINLYDDNGKLSAKLPYNSGLGRALSTFKILEILKQLNI